MVKACVQRTGINQVSHAQLLDVPKALKIRMRYQVEYQFRRNTDKTVNGVVYNFLFIQFIYNDTKMLNYTTCLLFYFS